MNYYIQGDAAKAQQIKAAFEKKGISDGGNSFIHSNYLYFSEGGEVDFCSIGGHIANIIKTHPDYQELELPVQPKFKVGDWVVRGEGFVYEPSLITEIRDYYICELLNGERVTYTLNDVHKNFHLWTIADAKDGDVLVCYSEVKGNPIEQAGIFKQYVGRHGGCSNAFLAHTGIDWDGNIIINGYMGSTNILPATKEQRDLLFKKMRETGYEWDADKKELKKIQPHYDIKNFHAGMPVLVRDYDNSHWSYVQFSHYVGECRMKFNACGIPYIQCIPYNDDTKHLLGTTDPCDEQYINW